MLSPRRPRSGPATWRRIVLQSGKLSGKRPWRKPTGRNIRARIQIQRSRQLAGGLGKRANRKGGHALTERSHILPEHDVRPYSIAQLAERWGCSDSMIRKLINQGQLGCFRIGALIRIPASEVVRFEEATTYAEAPAPEPETAPAPATAPRMIERARRRRPIKRLFLVNGG